MIYNSAPLTHDLSRNSAFTFLNIYYNTHAGKHKCSVEREGVNNFNKPSELQSREAYIIIKHYETVVIVLSCKNF